MNVTEQLVQATARIEALAAENADLKAKLQTATAADGGAARSVALQTERDRLASECSNLRVENAALTERLNTAVQAARDFDARVEQRVAEVRTRMDAEFESRANARAVEIMAGVGQPAPAPVHEFNNGREHTTAASPKTGVPAVEAMYQGKYDGNSNAGWNE